MARAPIVSGGIVGARSAPSRESLAMAERRKSVLPMTRWLALGAVAGPLLFTAVWVTLGLVSPGYTLFGEHIAPYSAVSQPISGLGLGITGPFMNAAFVGCGLLVLFGVAGVAARMDGIDGGARRICALLLALSPIGTALAGIFTLEAMMPHLVGFLLAAGAPVIAFAVTGSVLRRLPGWQRLGRWLLVSSPVTLVLLVLFFVTFDPVAAGKGQGIGGVTQRLLILEMHSVYVLLGLFAFRRFGQPSHPLPGG